MLVRQLYDNDLAQAAYLIGCQRTGEAIVIDPERDVDRYLALAAENEMRLVAAAETHIHADFLSGSRELAHRAGVHAYLSAEGGDDWQYGWPAADRGVSHTLLRDGDTFRIGELRFVAQHTPGHTPEHLSYVLYDRGSDDPLAVLSGDFVFVGDLGRPDLLETAAGMAGMKESAARALYASTKRLMELPEFTQVWPAHGSGSACGKALGAVPQSTVGYEKRHNASLLAATDETNFVSSILAGQPSPPLYFARMKHDNRDGPPLLGSLPEPEEISAGALTSATYDGAVLDLRPWTSFRDGHTPGALWSPLDVMFGMVAGSYIQPEERITLVCEPSQLDRAVRNLVRIGLDRVEAWVPAASIAPLGDALETTPEMTPADLLAQLGTPAVLDCRNPDEHDAGAPPAAFNIPYTRLTPRLDDLPRDRAVVCHCLTGIRSAAATAYLRREGFDVINLRGGIEAWEEAGGPVETPAAAAGA